MSVTHSGVSRVKQERQKVTGAQFRGPVKGPGSGPAKGRARGKGDTGAAKEGQEPSPSSLHSFNTSPMICARLGARDTV